MTGLLHGSAANGGVSGNPSVDAEPTPENILAQVRVVLAAAVKEGDEAGNDIEYVAFHGLVSSLQAISGLEPVLTADQEAHAAFLLQAGERYTPLIEAAGSMWATDDPTDFDGESAKEYLRGQVELISAAVRWPEDEDGDNIKRWIEQDIRASAKVQGRSNRN